MRWVAPLLAVLLTACGTSKPTGPVTTEVVFRLDEGPFTVRAEIADEPDEWRQGLMNRRSLPDRRGMLFVFKEAYERLRAPHDVHTGPMLIMAAIALIVNAGTAISLRRESRHDVNIRGAFVHMIGDAISSFGIRRRPRFDSLSTVNITSPILRSR